MNIGEAAKLSGLSDKTLRYYESIGLIKSLRSPNGYRDYQDQQIKELCFLASARKVGFTIDECKTLLEMFRNQNRHSSQVKHFVLDKLDHIEEQIQTLQSMKSALQNLANQCQDNENSSCAIIDGLSDSPVPGEKE